MCLRCKLFYFKKKIVNIVVKNLKFLLCEIEKFVTNDGFEIVLIVAHSLI